MEKFIINTNAALLKNILVSDTFIKVSDENYKTKSIFLEKLNAPKKGILDTNHHIDFDNITKIIPFESENGLQLFFTENNKKEKIFIQLNTPEEYDELNTFILSKTINLQKQVVKNKTVASWIKQAIYTLISIAFTFAVYFNAKQIEAGEWVSVNGGKRGLKKILISIAEILGTTNSILLGTIITLSFAFWTYKNYTKGQGEITIYQ